MVHPNSALQLELAFKLFREIEMSGVVSDKKLTSVPPFQVQFLAFEQQQNFHSFSDQIAMNGIKWEISLALACKWVLKSLPIKEGVTYVEPIESF